MRLFLGAFLAALTLATSAHAGDERASAIVGTVFHRGQGTKAIVTIHRLGGTEILDQRVPALDESIVRTVETDEAGIFEVDGLASGVYTLVARRDRELAGDAVVSLYAGARSEARIPLEPARTLAGVVTWADGRPVEGVARFRTRWMGGHTRSGPWNPWWDAAPLSRPAPAFETTLVDGTFRISLTSRPTNITIDTPDGCRILGGESWNPAKGEETVTWTVSVPEATVEGRVVDEAGEVVPGATVRTTHREAKRAPVQTVATSGPDGRFALRVVSMPVALSVMAEGVVKTHVSEFEGDDIVVRRHAAAVVEGRVVRAGEPVPGAVVHVVPTDRQAREWWADARREQSDAKGRYRIDDVPAGPVAVFVRGGGFASVDLASVRASGSNPFTMTFSAGEVATRNLDVEPSAGLQGRVLDHEGGAVVGATLVALGVTAARGGQPGFESRLAIRAHVGPFVATTDAEGCFAYDDLVPGHLLSIRVDAPGMPQVRTVLRPAADPTVRDIRFPRPRYLTVRAVEAQAGSPVAKAWVSLDSFGVSRRTGDDGIARFGPLGDGVMRGQIRADGFVPVVGWEAESSAEGAGPFDVTVPLERGLTITGRVLDEEGAPLSQAHIVAHPLADRGGGMHSSGSTDEKGAFILRGLLAGTWKLTVVFPGRDRRRIEAEAEAGATDLTLRVEEAVEDGRVFTIRVTDPDGNAIPSARASLVGFRGSRLSSSVRDGVARLDATAIDPEEFEKGHVFAYISGAKERRGNVRLPYGVGVRGPLRLDEREITVVLPPERSITGRVLDPEGEPVKGARVVVLHPLPGPTGEHDPDRWSGNRTDAEGRFTVHYLGDGGHVLEVDAGPRFLYPRQEAEAGARDIEIHLSPAASARLVIVDPAGAPVPGALLRLSMSARDREARRKRDPKQEQPRIRRALRRPDSFTAADDGSIVLEGLVPGQLHSVTVYGRRDDLQDLRIRDWLPVSGEIRLEHGVVIAGRVLDENGSPATDAVVAVDGENSWRGNRCREDGTFRYTRLRPGTYRLLAGREGTQWEDPSVQIRTVEGGVEDLVIRIPTPFFEAAGDERKTALASLVPDAIESAERSVRLLYQLSRYKALQHLSDELRWRREPLLRARSVWPRRTAAPEPDATLIDADVERFATLVPGADTYGLLVVNQGIARLPAALLPAGDRKLWDDNLRRTGTYESLDEVFAALAAFLGDTTAFALARRRDDTELPLPSKFYPEAAEYLPQGPALAVMAPLRPGTEPEKLEAWLEENLPLFVDMGQVEVVEHEGVRYRRRARANGWEGDLFPWLAGGRICYAVVNGHLVLTNREPFLRAILDTHANPSAYPPLQAKGSFASLSRERMKGAHTYAFLDINALRAVPAESGEGRWGLLWDLRHEWILEHRSPRDAAVAQRRALIEKHEAEHGRPPNEEESPAIEEAVEEFWEAYLMRYPEFELEYGKLLEDLRGHALSLAFHVSKCFVHGEMLLYVDPPKAADEGGD